LCVTEQKLIVCAIRLPRDQAFGPANGLDAVLALKVNADEPGESARIVWQRAQRFQIRSFAESEPTAFSQRKSGIRKQVRASA